MNDGQLKLTVFSFVLSILFPTFAYALTTFGDQPEFFDITLDNNELINAGIILSDGESHNVTYNDVYKEYNVSEVVVRVNWKQSVAPPDFFRHITQSWLGKRLGTWLGGFFHLIKPIIDTNVLPETGMNNITVINNFNLDYNWTYYGLKERNLVALISTLPSDNNNITKAIMETGTVTVTIGTKLIEADDINFKNFASWYINIVTGDIDWGMPSFMLLIMRVFTFMTILSGILLAREILPIP
jgi:hypothetical protein